MSARKVEFVFSREDYTTTTDEASLTMRFYNDAEALPIKRVRQTGVDKEASDSEVVTMLLQEFLHR